MWKRLKSDPSPPSNLRPECPPELDAIILKAMSRAPEDRFQTARDMLEQLENVAPDKLPADPSVSVQPTVAGFRGAAVSAVTEDAPVHSYLVGRMEAGVGQVPPRMVERTAEALGLMSHGGGPDLASKGSRPQSPPTFPSAAPHPSSLFDRPNSPQGGGWYSGAGGAGPLIVGPLELNRHRPLSGPGPRVRDGYPPGARDSRERGPSTSVFSFSHDDLMLLLLTMIVVVGLGLLLRVFGLFDGGGLPTRPSSGGAVTMGRLGFDDGDR